MVQSPEERRLQPGEWDQFPLTPGVYCFYDEQDRILYVGKSIRLRERVRSYFRSPRQLPRSKRAMVRAIRTVQIQETGSELEALLLEAEWIRTRRPPYNVALRRQRTPLFLQLNPQEAFPALTLTREVRRDEALYFGPLGPQEVGEALQRMLQKLLGLRVCDGSLRPHQTHRPCLALEIHLCTGPCVGEVSEATYRQQVQQAVKWVSGEELPLLEVLEEQVQNAVADLRFEEAAGWHGGLQTLRHLRRPLHLPLQEQTGLLLSSAGKEGTWKALLIRDARLVSSFSPTGRWRETLRRRWHQLTERPPSDGEPLSGVELYRIRLLRDWLRRAPERYPFLRWHTDLTPSATADWMKPYLSASRT